MPSCVPPGRGRYLGRATRGPPAPAYYHGALRAPKQHTAAPAYYHGALGAPERHSRTELVRSFIRLPASYSSILAKVVSAMFARASWVRNA